MFGGSLTAAVLADRLGQVVARAGELAAPRLYRDGRFVADYWRLRFVAVAEDGNAKAQASFTGRWLETGTGKRTWCSNGARPTPAPRPSRGCGTSCWPSWSART